MTRGLLVAALVLSACGGFQNSPLEAPDAAAPDLGPEAGSPDTAPTDARPPCPGPVPLEPLVDYLPGVRVGEAYVAPLRLATYPEQPVSWWLEEGALPAGLVLDPASGLLHGRAHPTAPGSWPLRFGAAPLGGDACVTAGLSAPRVLKVFGACDGTGPGCLPPLVCGAGRCRLEGADCPTAPPSPVWIGMAGKARGLRRFSQARVLSNTRDANPAAPVRYARLELDDSTPVPYQAFGYHLPDDLLLPVAPNHVVTVGTWFDDAGSSALSITDAEGQFVFFAYDGPLGGPPFLAICKSLGACPLQDLANLLSDCAPSPRADGSAVVGSTLKLVAEQRTALATAGETVPLSDAPGARLALVGQAEQLVDVPPTGPASPTVWHSFLVQRSSACPTATVHLTSRALADGAVELRLDGRPSRSLGTSVVDWQWTLTPPPGNDATAREETPGDPSVLRLVARAAGLYGVALTVRDARDVLSCVPDFVTWRLDPPAAP